MLRRRINKLFLADELPIEGRLFNVIVTLGIAGSFIAFIVNSLNRETLLGALFIFLLVLSLIVLFAYANRSRHYHTASMIICIGICCVLYPIIAFTSRGFVSGMPS